jgi:coenzyme F420 hydrogenase subunit beta
MSEQKTFQSLRILPQESSLRGDNVFRASERFPLIEGEAQAPRALRALSHIVDEGLCHRCGTCVGICPTGVLAVDKDDYPTVKNLSACTDCDLCVKVCPGDEFDFLGQYKQFHGKDGDLKDTHGSFLDSTIAYSTEPFIREHSTSGGVVSAILCHMLETKQIDGAVCITSDSEQLWKGKPIIARSKEEILSAMKSKYAITPTNSVFAEIRQIPGKYAVVGLPCQMHGLRKAMQLDPRLKERVVVSIGLFCHAAIEHEAFRVIWESLGDKTKGATKFISRIGKHPGAPNLVQADGSLYPIYFGDRKGYRPSSLEVLNILYRLYTPERCMTCFDGLSEFADISVGDPWLPAPDPSVDWYQGWSFCLMRSEKGRQVYQSLVDAGKLHSVDVTAKEARSSNKLMAVEKRWRAFRVIETQRRQGKPIPQYGDDLDEFPKTSGLQFIETEAHMLTHIFCYIPKYRAAILKFMLGQGYWLFYLNNLRRRFRVFARDNIYIIKKKLFGRK